MKKEYINPEIEIVEIEVTHSILAGSNLDDFGGGSGDGSGADVSAPFADFEPDIPGVPGFGF